MEIYLFQVAPQIYLLSKLWNLLDRILHSWLVVKVSRREGRREKFETSDFLEPQHFVSLRSLGQCPVHKSKSSHSGFENWSKLIWDGPSEKPEAVEQFIVTGEGENTKTACIWKERSAPPQSWLLKLKLMAAHKKPLSPALVWGASANVLLWRSRILNCLIFYEEKLK